MDSKSEAEEQPKETYPLLIDYLPDEYLQKAEKELNETAENSTRLLQELKSMAKNEKVLDGLCFHEDFLRQMLRQKKYDVQKAFKRLVAYINFRKSNAKYFENVDSEKLANISDYSYCTPLPWRCEEGCTVIHYEMAKLDPDNIPVEDLLRLALLMTHQSLRNPMAQINGLKLIVDWKDASLRQIKFFTPLVLYRSYQALMTISPARVKKIHMVNETLIMKIFWTLFKPFLSTKMKNRFMFHNSLEDLLNYFPKQALPAQYGGELENFFYMGDWVKEANEQQRISTLEGQRNLF